MSYRNDDYRALDEMERQRLEDKYYSVEVDDDWEDVDCAYDAYNDERLMEVL